MQRKIGAHRRYEVQSRSSATIQRTRLLANRQLWKNAIYAVALITYICSFLFFGLAAAAVRQSNDVRTAIMDMLVALYFVLQVIFLFILSTIVERRRQSRPISFPNRRKER